MSAIAMDENEKRLSPSRQWKTRDSSPWLGSVYTTVTIRGHILLVNILLSRDAHTAFIIINRFFKGNDWHAVLINHTKAQRTHTSWNHPWMFLKLYLQKNQCRIHVDIPITGSSYVHLLVSRMAALTLRCEKLRLIKSNCLSLYYTVGLFRTEKQNSPSISPLSTLCI